MRTIPLKAELTQGEANLRMALVTDPPSPDPVRVQVFRGTEREEVLLDK